MAGISLFMTQIFNSNVLNEKKLVGLQSTVDWGQSPVGKRSLLNRCYRTQQYGAETKKILWNYFCLRYPIQFLLKSTGIAHMAPRAGTTHQWSIKAQSYGENWKVWTLQCLNNHRSHCFLQTLRLEDLMCAKPQAWHLRKREILHCFLHRGVQADTSQAVPGWGNSLALPLPVEKQKQPHRCKQAINKTCWDFCTSNREDLYFM